MKKSFIGGSFISLGTFAYLVTLQKTGNLFLAAITFYLGLFLILTFKSYLFTGAVYTLRGDNDYVTKLMDIWCFNLLGGGTTTLLLIQIFSVDVTNILANKMLLSSIQLIISGIFCNILVCAAVCVYQKYQNHLLSGFLIVCFVLLGFEHSVANFTYLTIGMCQGIISIAQFLLNVLYVTLGNIIGGRIIIKLEEQNA